MAPYSLKASKLGRVILLYLLFTLLTGAVELIMYRSIDSIYMLMRYSLSMASVLVLPKLILNSNYFRVLMKAVALSLVINAVLASSWVFPVTRSAMQIVFKQEILYPQKDAFLEDLEKDQASRGRTLAGNSNSTAFLLFTGIIISLTLVRLKIGKLPWYIFPGLILGLMSILLTLSRSAYLTLALLLGYMFLKKGSRKYVRYFIISGVFVGGIFLMFNINSSTVDFERITKSFDMATGEQKLGYGEEARVLSWTLPLQRVVEDPKYLFYGRGISINKIKRSKGGELQTDFSLRGGLNHSFFASITYERGLLAFFIFLSIYAKLWSKSFRELKRLKEARLIALREMVRLLLLNLVFPLLVAHYLTDSEMGSYQLFFVFAIVITTINFIHNERSNYISSIR
ncbi:MAG: hypothetical protein CL843_15590 [Crocinitomicaceae bacterium]|nr:hypothetical protein [Crocinitomicaceae bacterium]